MIATLMTTLALTLTALPQPADAVDIRIRIVQFSEVASGPPVLRSIPLLGGLINPEGEALARLPGISLDTPVGQAFADRDHYTLINRGANVDQVLSKAAEQDGVTLLSAPRLMVLPGQPASIRVGAAVRYLESRDGCLQVVTDDALHEGLAVDLTVGDASAERVAFDEITVTLHEIVSRQPIDGVPFDVGRPVLATRVAKMQLSLSPEHVGVFPVPRADADDLPVLLFVTAEYKGSAGARE